MVMLAWPAAYPWYVRPHQLFEDMQPRNLSTTRDLARFVGVGAAAGGVSTLAFTFAHQVLISSIWFAFPIMLGAGVLCGLCLALSFALTDPAPTIRRWLRYNLSYLAMFIALGITSIIVFEPVTTIAALLRANEPPRELISRALPVTGVFAVASAGLLTLVQRASARGALIIFVTTTVLILFLGLNISILGLVAVPRSELGTLVEVFGLLIAILGVYATVVALFERFTWGRNGATDSNQPAV
jgi:hypothetical protein